MIITSNVSSRTNRNNSAISVTFERNRRGVPIVLEHVDEQQNQRSGDGQRYSDRNHATRALKQRSRDNLK